MPKIIAFTGIPNVSIDTSVEIFKDFLEAEKGLRCKVISLDDFVREAFKEFNNNLHGNLSTDYRRSFWYLFLKLSQTELQKIWDDGCLSALKEIKKFKENQDLDYILVHFHLSYFSYKYKWRVSVANIKLLENFGFSAIIHLIDDIYDILVKDRSSRTAIIEETKNNNIQDENLRFLRFIELTAHRLIHYIEWRQIDSLLGDALAAQMNIPSFVFSVNHVKETLQKLIESLDETTYLSHPITEVRRHLEIDDSESNTLKYKNFSDSELFNEIDNIANVARSETCLLEPTTIDEYRFDKIKIINQEKTKQEGKNSYDYFLTPNLSPRWILENINELLTAQVQNQRRLPVNCIFQESCLNDDTIELDNVKKVFTSGKLPDIIYARIHSIINLLASKIEQDICWRDHHLVEQTNNLLVIRPSYKGHSSGGVKRELQYFARKNQVNSLKRKAIIYHPLNDSTKNIEKTSEEIINKIQTIDELKSNFSKKLDSEKKSLNQEIIRILTNFTQNLDSEESSTMMLLLRNLIQAISSIVSPKVSSTNDGRFLDESVNQQLSESEEKIWKKIGGIIEELLREETFYIEVMKKELSSENILFLETASEVKKKLRNNFFGKGGKI